MRDAVELAGPLRTPLGLAQWKRASSPGKAYSLSPTNSLNSAVREVMGKSYFQILDRA